MIKIFVSILLVSGVFRDIKAELDNSKNVLNNRFIVDAVIRQLFEMFKEVIKNGNDETGVPVLDPYKFEHATFELIKFPFPINEDGIGMGTVNILLLDGMLSGLGDYQLGAFTFTKSDISMDLELSFPKISIMSDYKIDGNILEYVANSGKGIIEMQIENITIKGKIFLKQSDDGKSILLSHFDGMQFTINSIKSAVQFDNNADRIINAMIEELLPSYLSEFSKFICAQYGNQALGTINEVLSKLETWYIIAAVLGN